jgi:hypothetical protein
MAGVSRNGVYGRGSASYGMAGKERRSWAGPVMDWQARMGEASNRSERFGKAGMEGPGSARHGTAMQAWTVRAGLGWAGRGQA